MTRIHIFDFYCTFHHTNDVFLLILKGQISLHKSPIKWFQLSGPTQLWLLINAACVHSLATACEVVCGQQVRQMGSLNVHRFLREISQNCLDLHQLERSLTTCYNLFSSHFKVKFKQSGFKIFIKTCTYLLFTLHNTYWLRLLTILVSHLYLCRKRLWMPPLEPAPSLFLGF